MLNSLGKDEMVWKDVQRAGTKCKFANSETKCSLSFVTTHLDNENPKPLYA